jgi:hypothetical protein
MIKLIIRIFISMDNHRMCNTCKINKPITSYYKSQRSHTCIECFLKRNNENKKKLRDNHDYKIIESEKQKERRFRLWQNTLVHDSKRKNVEHTISVKDIDELYKKQNGLCFWFKVPLIPSKNKKHPQQPSIDRLDRYKGYTKDNIVLCCYSANIGRNENTVDEWLKFIEIIKENIVQIKNN